VQIEARVGRVLGRIGGAGGAAPLRLSTTSPAAVDRPRDFGSAAPSPTDADDDGGERDVDRRDDDDDEDDAPDRRGMARHLPDDDDEATMAPPVRNYALDDDSPRIRHRVIRLNEKDRTRALRHLLERRRQGEEQRRDGDDDEDEWDRVLVFVATRHKAEQVSRKLRKYGVAASEIHGKLDQADRDARLGAFRSGKTRVLIATDLAARGIDVPGLSAVINYDLPRGADDFVHRTGRTGRAGRSGTAISFVSADTESHFDFLEKRVLMSSSSSSSLKIEREMLEGFAIDEAAWASEYAASTTSVPGSTHSDMGLGHDRTFGGVKGRRTSKKDKLREAAAAEAAAAAGGG
jgi:superfamily II DNA/RNA helicase